MPGEALGSRQGSALAWSVGALLLALSDALAARFATVTVQGEIASFNRAASGHCYFTLRDADGPAASLRCAMFRRAASQLAFAPVDGAQVVLRGRLAVYEARGELQLVVESMQTLGAGTLYERFLALRDRLQREGLFDPARKRPLPRFPRRLGLITSASGAAVHDVLTTLARRSAQVSVVLYASPVQGAEAAARLVQALQTANARREVDVLLLVRGGGSLEDLWSFNDEALVRAVASSELPVVCGVGHETDVTLCDHAASLRAATPTAAAELVAPARQDLLDDLAALAHAARQALARRLERQAVGLDALAARLGRPARGLSVQRQGLERQAERLRRVASSVVVAHRRRLQDLSVGASRGTERTLLRASHRLDSHQQRLAALDPRAVLRRGYAWVQDRDGRTVTSAAGLAPGQSLRAVWSDGRAEVEVRTVERDAGPGPGSSS